METPPVGRMEGFPSLSSPSRFADAREVLGSLLRSLQRSTHRLQRHPELTLQEFYNELHTNRSTPARALNVIEGAARKHCGAGRSFVRLRRSPSDELLSLERTIDLGRSVTACDLHPRRPLIAAAVGASVALYDSSSGEVYGKLEGHRDAIRDCRFTPDGEGLITASDDGVAMVWDLPNGAPVLQLEGHEATVNACDASPCGRFLSTASEDHTARLWDRTTGRCLHVLEGHEYGVSCCRFHPAGGLLLTGSLDRTLRLWDVETGTEVRRFTLPGPSLKGRWSLDGIEALAFNADGSRFVACSTGGELAWWNTASSQLQEYIVKRGSRLSCCAISEPSLFLAAGHEPDLLAWCEGEALPPKRIRAHAGSINGLVARSGSGTVVSAGEDGMVRLWDSRNPGSGHREASHERAISVVVACPGEGGRALTAGYDGRVILWDLTTGAALRLLGNHDRAVSCAAASETDPLAVSADEGGDVSIWHLDDAAAGPIRMRAESPVLCCSVSPTSGLVACGDLDGSCHVWNPGRGTKVTLALHQDSIRTCGFLTDERLLTTGDDGRILLSGLDGTSGPAVLAEGLRVSCRAVGRNVAILCTMDRVGILRLFPQTMRGLRLPFSNCRSCCLSDDGGRALIAGEGAVAIVDTETAELSGVLQCPDDPTTCAFLAGGRYAAAGSSSGTVRFWNLHDEVECGLFHTGGGVTSMAADPGRNRLLVGTSSGEAYVLELREGS